MKCEWLNKHLCSKKNCVKDYKAEWEAYRFMLKDKMFCMIGEDKTGNAIVTLKCEPEFGVYLRKEYKDIIPGYYMNKIYWNSVYLEGDVPDDILKQMIDMSYDLILKSLRKKDQADMLNN